MLGFFAVINLICAGTIGVKKQSVRAEQGVEGFNSIKWVLLLVDCSLDTGSVSQFKQGVRMSFHNRAYLCACLALEKLVDLADVTICVGRELHGQVAQLPSDPQLR